MYAEVGQNIKVGVLGGHMSHQILTKYFLSGIPICLLTPYMKMILGFSRIKPFQTNWQQHRICGACDYTIVSLISVIFNCHISCQSLKHQFGRSHCVHKCGRFCYSKLCRSPNVQKAHST